MKNFILLAAILCSVQVKAGGGSSVGPANPAALNCIKLGGTLEPFTTPQGESNNCVIDEWQLYREMSKRHLVKEHRYDGIALPNPAAVNCVDSGGEIRIMHTPAGEAGYCVIEEWQLFRVIDVITQP